MERSVSGCVLHHVFGAAHGAGRAGLRLHPTHCGSELRSRCAHIGRARDGGDDGYAVGSSRHHGGRGIGRNAADTHNRNCDACGAQFRHPAGPSTAWASALERVGYMGPTPR